jgi:hypothetical protein
MATVERQVREWRKGNSGSSPYFALGVGASLIGDGATGICGNVGGVVACSDPASLGAPDSTPFYLVRAFNAAASADLNRVGGFAFALQPGSP